MQEKIEIAILFKDVFKMENIIVYNNLELLFKK
jgi:hypothetical protein